MIPIGKDRDARLFPVVMWLLILANLGTFLWQLYLGDAGADLVRQWALVPERLWHLDPTGAATGLKPYLRSAWLPLLTCMFLHGGWVHLLGNLVSLRVFGDQVEERLGHGRFLFFYMGCGVLASLLHVAVGPHSRVPTIGASGAIAGVLGAYLLLFPFEWVRFVVPVFVVPILVKLPAVVYLVLWIAAQVLGGYRTLADGSQVAGGIAFWAHIGGFLAGMYWIHGWRRHAPKRSRRR